MANKSGPMLIGMQSWSDKWIGYIDCGNGVFRLSSKTRSGKPKNQYFREGICAFCKKEALLTAPSGFKHGGVFCSPLCKYESVKANHNGNRHIKSRPGGGHHILVLSHGHPRATKGGQVYEHILVAEKMLGRQITKTEIVHHINCIKSDNSPENLFVCSGSSEHFSIHGSLNKCVADLISDGSIWFDRESKTYKVKK